MWFYVSEQFPVILNKNIIIKHIYYKYDENNPAELAEILQNENSCTQALV
ncbi:hypothetical protein NTGM5_120088 [Candidatus Nitrotoga sp. M5]|nr:hypothetical protein NTGM5_120088 [Candidatus Nitrotoga sp. M5]